MEASKLLEPELQDPFEREVEAALPEGEDRASAMLRADYLLQRIREEHERRDVVGEFTARRIMMVKEHGEDELRKIDGRIARLESRLRMHVPQTGEGMQAEFGKKSLALPHGTIGYKASPATVRIVDAAAVVEWSLRGEGNKAVAIARTIQEKPIFSSVKDHFERTGELPPGVEYVDASESFYVKPKGEE